MGVIAGVMFLALGTGTYLYGRRYKRNRQGEVVRSVFVLLLYLTFSRNAATGIELVFDPNKKGQSAKKAHRVRAHRDPTDGALRMIQQQEFAAAMKQAEPISTADSAPRLSIVASRPERSERRVSVSLTPTPAPRLQAFQAAIPPQAAPRLLASAPPPVPSTPRPQWADVHDEADDSAA